MPSELTLRYADIEAALSPERGAIVTQLKVRGRDLLFLDRATFDDPTKNVRGGVPMLFPFSGKLENGIFLPAGTQMGQHGFARSKPWECTFRAESEVRCRLASDAQTQAIYPYAFELEQTCLIVPGGLQIELQIANLGSKPMPVAPGWHPYFACPANRKTEIKIDIPGFDTSRFTNDTEFDFGIAAPRNGRATFVLPETGKIQLSFAPNMRLLQFWTQPQRPFACIEPCAGPANLINTPGTPMIKPGAAETFWMRVQLVE